LLITLLPALVWLQYHWLGQLSAAEKVRMQANLEISTKHFCEKFDRNMTSVYQAFSQPGISNPKSITRAWQLWRQNSGYPALIDSIYNIKSEQMQISVLDTVLNVFKKKAWPDFMQNYEHYFDAANADNHMKIMALTNGPVLDSVSFILIPLKDHWLDIANRPEEYLLIRLNKKMLLEKLIPDLVRQFFFYEDELPYLVSIMKSDHIFYASDDQISLSAMDQADAKSKIGKWQSQNFVFATTDIELKPFNAIKKSIKEEVSINRLAIKIVREDSNSESNLTRYFISHLPDWELRVKHKMGSLESVISRNRQFNITLSSGILLILILALLLTLFSARRLEALARRQMEFVAGVTHELRTPLAVIRSAGENIADGLVKKQDQLQKYGAVIRDEGRRLSESVEQALQFAGINSAAKKYTQQTINLNNFFKNLINNIDFEKCEFEIKNDDPHLEIKSDIEALSTVFTNLIQNAIKFSKEPGKVTVEIKKGEQQIDVSVIDSGIGIPAKEIKYIFDPFYRADNAASQQISGYGLGLAVAKSILTALNAEITVESSIEAGTKFIVSFKL
jgi:signal transduction histidine kinase